MRHLLSILPKPSRYVGIEEGSVHKKPESVRLRTVLAFPDMYEVGMSYLGQKILYGLINENPEWSAERVFTPCADAGRILKDNEATLCSLESGTPLADFDVIGFSLTHELCYTNVLYMLDLAGIPLYSADRSESCPLVIAGGGCTMAAEPVAPFFDAMLIGDGEEIFPDFLNLLGNAKAENLSKRRFLEDISRIPGVYVPSLFTDSGGRMPPVPNNLEYQRIKRRAVTSLDDAFYPVSQVVPFGAVHNRLALEIARGCTRSCRFCQAGMIYRPVRERSVDNLENMLGQCLSVTGYDDVSYLSLSTGDFSALKTFFGRTVERCAAEQISVSLPSLRVGSIDDSIMERMSSIKRTGATLAPEAGSQRLRDVINKGITEDEVILHTRKLFEYGWQQIKLYFMIGLPTETDEDILAIMDLARKVRDAAGPGIKRLQITVSVSPFVPKAHTPFQWEPQVPLEEILRRVSLLLTAVKGEKRIKLRWHEPRMSFLEGIFSRGDRRLAPVVESAYRKGALFTSWIDQFQLEPWLEAMEEHGLTPGEFTGPLDLNNPLPWEHLDCGVDKDFLLRERERGLDGKITPDCRYGACRQCGACDTKTAASLLAKAKSGGSFGNILNFTQRDQAAHQARLDEYGRVIAKTFEAGGKDGKNMPPVLAAGLTAKVSHYQIWYSKTGPATCLSQLELQAIFERAMRRGRLPLAFSRGFRPGPLLSFARALPVGVASRCEWFSLYLRETRTPQEVLAAFAALPLGIVAGEARKLPLNLRPGEALSETFIVEWMGAADKTEAFHEAMKKFKKLNSLEWVKKGKKHDKNLDIRSLIAKVSEKSNSSYELLFDWYAGYASPLALTLAGLGLAHAGLEDFFRPNEFLLSKISQDGGGI